MVGVITLVWALSIVLSVGLVNTMTPMSDVLPTGWRRPLRFTGLIFSIAAIFLTICGYSLLTYALSIVGFGNIQELAAFASLIWTAAGLCSAVYITVRFLALALFGEL